MIFRTSYVCPTQTTRRRLSLQCVCFLEDLSLKKVCATSFSCRHGSSSSYLFCSFFLPDATNTALVPSPLLLRSRPPLLFLHTTGRPSSSSTPPTSSFLSAGHPSSSTPPATPPPPPPPPPSHRRPPPPSLPTTPPPPSSAVTRRTLEIMLLIQSGSCKISVLSLMI
ncbi:leucine-rich repeat extensin-like protein 3 [Helianthus annuus]|uniref:leucine-rich repeat extensin-like protein 3 n=1 Tax=Helianthus annuus TaxID=4232 RepID=UPI001652DB89|nr:leucine-rich repeat extensin-like protein 3 [Helianthus annuus]